MPADTLTAFAEPVHHPHQLADMENGPGTGSSPDTNSVTASGMNRSEDNRL
jgi:hypothetical protein